MNKNIKGVIPKWRFESFDSYPKWDIKKLGCLMEPIKERAGDKKYVLMSVTSGVGLIPQVEKFGREIAGNSYKNYYVIRKNDFAYNKSSTKEFPEGYISMLKEYEEAAIPNSIFTCFRVIDDEYEPLFFDQLFNTNYHGKWLRKYIEIGARAHGALSIDTKHLWNMPVAVPKLPEQQKIANCLSSIDDLISTEEKKLSLLNDYKKGWMQKLFPAERKTVPEWRFTEFQNNEEWETAKLINIADYRRGSFPQPYGLAKWYDEFNGMPFIQVFDVDDNMRLKATTKNKISKLASKQSVFIGKGTLIVTLQGSIGRVAITQYDAYIDRTLLLFEKFYRDIDKVFFAYIIQRLFEIKKQSAPGGIIKTITKQALSEFTVKLPERPEQEKIADFLSGIDDLISTQTDRIEALKQHKKALMQGLFPDIEEVL
jgi:restriction modification system specificity subunit